MGESWSIDPDTVAERMGDKIIIVHLRANKIYELNTTAARIYELLRQGVERPALVRALLSEFAVQPEEVAESLDRVLVELRAARVLR